MAIHASNPPDGLAIASRNRKVLGLKWNAVPNATHYVVQYGTHPQQLTQSQQVTGPEATIGNLDPATSYWFQVQAQPAKAGSPSTELVQGNTPS